MIPSDGAHCRSVGGYGGIEKVFIIPLLVAASLFVERTPHGNFRNGGITHEKLNAAIGERRLQDGRTKTAD